MNKETFLECLELLKTEIDMQFSEGQEFSNAEICALTRNDTEGKRLYIKNSNGSKCEYCDAWDNAISIRRKKNGHIFVTYIPYSEIISLNVEIS